MKKIFLSALMIGSYIYPLERITQILNQSNYQMQFYNYHTEEIILRKNDGILPERSGTIAPNTTIIPEDFRVPWADKWLGMRHQHIRITPIAPQSASPWIAFMGAINGEIHLLIRKRGETLEQAHHSVIRGTSEAHMRITNDTVTIEPARGSIEKGWGKKEDFLKALNSYAYTPLEGEVQVKSR